jgi:hypothetical protein
MTIVFTTYMVLESLHLAKRLLVPCATDCASFPGSFCKEISRGVGGKIPIISKLRPFYSSITLTIYQLGKNNLEMFG